MSTGDAVCTGWLVKSPPERKLQRYVSRGANSILTFVPSVLCPWCGPVWPWGVPDSRRAKVTVPRALAAGEESESEIAHRTVLLLRPAAGWPGASYRLCSVSLYCHSQL